MMKICVFSARKYDRLYFDRIKPDFDVELDYFDIALNAKTARLAHQAQAVCAFVNDDISRSTLEVLHENGIKLVLMRCAGFNNVDLAAANELGITVARVPAYSPEATAEHAIALIMALNRRIHKAYQRTRDANFSLEGLIGFNMHGKTAGVVGTGKIGAASAKILLGFGCRVLGFDPYPNAELQKLGVEYVELDQLLAESDVITLHAPLTEENHYLINKEAFDKMKKGVILVNTSRGKLLDSHAAIDALKNGTLWGLGLDVYENEQNLFFEDLSSEVIQDDVFRRLSACHNVIFTGHQAFFTKESLTAIATTTLNNAVAFQQGKRSGNELTNALPDEH